jgi:hypothetical protein
VKEQRFQPLDLLRKLGDEYRRVEQEHQREPAYRGAIRHRLADQMHALETHFERVLVAMSSTVASGPTVGRGSSRRPP